VNRIVTADPHAFNALKHDYRDIPPVEHISSVILKGIKSGIIQLKNVEDSEKIYTYPIPITIHVILADTITFIRIRVRSSIRFPESSGLK